MTTGSNSKAVVVVGAGGHGKVTADVARAAGYRVLGFVDDVVTESPLSDVRLLGRLSSLGELEIPGRFVLVAGIGENRSRVRVVEELSAAGFEFVRVVASSAVVSVYATVSPGTVVMSRVVVNAGAEVGAYAILNTGCVVEHDCEIGDYAHLSPGVCLSGGVKIGRGAHLGTGAAVVPGITIGEWSVVGAGAVVTRDIGAGVVAVGVPAVARKRRAAAESRQEIGTEGVWDADGE